MSQFREMADKFLMLQCPMTDSQSGMRTFERMVLLVLRDS
jgi:hypothetical protein